MLSYEARKYLESEIQKLQEKRTSLFTNKIRLSQKYAKLHATNQKFCEDEKKLKDLIEDFHNKIFDALSSRYEYNAPSCNERLKELSDLLEKIEKQVQLINWD